MRASAIATLSFAIHALCIPSCVQWNIGKGIRECAETRVGVMPWEVYLVGEARAKEFPPDKPETGARWDGRVRIAREVRYEADTPLVRLHPGYTLWPRWAAAQHIELTPCFRRADFPCNKLTGISATVGDRYDPAGQKMERDQSHDDWIGSLNVRTLGCAEVERSAWYPLAAIAAAPFDYIIDPALSVASAPVAAIGTAVYIGCENLARCARVRQRRAEEAQATPSAESPQP